MRSRAGAGRDRAPRGWAGMLAVGLAVGCGDAGPVDVFLELPAPQTAKTVAVGVPERSGVRVFLGDLAASGLSIEPGPRARDDAPIQVAYLPEALTDARLEPGWQREAAAGEPQVALTLGASPPLGDPLAIFEADLAADAPAWRSVANLDPQIASFPLPLPASTCQPFDAPSVAETVDVPVIWAVGLGTEAALIGGADGSYAIAGRTGAPTLTTPSRRYRSGILREGTLYLGDVDGVVWRGLPDATTIIRDEGPLGDPLPSSVIALAAGSGEDVFALLLTNELFHYDGRTWTLLGRVADALPRITWLGPNEAVVLTGQPGVVVFARDGALRTERIAEAGLIAAELVPGLGLVLGTSDGELLARSAGGWGRLGDKRYGWWVLDMIVDRSGGLTFLLASGIIAGYRDSEGFCDDLSMTQIISRGWLVDLGDALLVVGKMPDVDRARVDVFATP